MGVWVWGAAVFLLGMLAGAIVGGAYVLHNAEADFKVRMERAQRYWAR